MSLSTSEVQATLLVDVFPKPALLSTLEVQVTLLVDVFPKPAS